MKRFIKTLSALFSILIIVSILTPALNVNAEENVYSGTTGDCSWEYDPDTKTITISGEGDMENYGYFEVTKHAPWYKFRAEIENVVFGSKVNTVGHYSFEKCSNLINIAFSEKITSIGQYAFSECIALKKIDLNEKLNKIFGGAFYSCKSLTDVKLNDTIDSIGVDAFANCTSLKSIKLPHNLSDCPSFKNCTSLEQISLPLNATLITDDFVGCSSLKKVYLQHNIREIYSNSFTDCDNLTDVYYCGTEEEWDNIRNNSQEIKNADLHFTQNINFDFTWDYNKNTATLTLSKDGAIMNFRNQNDVPWFKYHDKIRSIVVEEGVTYLGENLFSNCTDVVELKLPDSLKEIHSTLRYCDLEQLEIPKNVEIIDSYAFQNCTKLWVVYINGPLKKLNFSLFRNCTSLNTIHIPSTVTEISRYAFDNCPISRVFYGGSKEEWKNIEILDYNDSLKSAKIIYNQTNENIASETTVPPTTAEFTAEPIETTVPPTTAESTTEPVETTVPPTTAGPITQPIETTLPPTTTGPITEPIETTVPPTTAGPITQPIETTLPPTTAEPITEPIESTLTPVITPITIPSVVTEPTEPPMVKAKKASQKISAKSYNKLNGDKPFKIKAKAKSKLSFSTKSKAVKLDKDGNVIIKTAGVAVIKIRAASTSKYKSAVKSIKIVIRPKTVKLTRAKGTEKKYIIHFKKQKGVSGYELRYKPVGSKKWKTVTASKSSYFTIKKLKYAKHIIRASAYIKDGKKKIYGKYNQKFFGPN